MKICSVCNKAKPLEEFHRGSSSADGHQPRCKNCSRMHHKIYHQKNKDKLCERTKKWREDNIMATGHKISESPKRISPDQVSRDNSDIWRYSPELYSALRKEKFSKANPEAFIDYKDALGDLALESPYESLDLRLDIEKFKLSLSDTDLEIFELLMLGMKQKEITEVVGLCQAAVSKRLRKIRDRFRDFYFDGE